MRRRSVCRIVLGAVVAVLFLTLSVMLAAAGLEQNMTNAAVSNYRDEYCASLDDVGPWMDLVGDTEVILRVGDTYEDPGVEVEDFCEVASNEIIGQVDTGVDGTYELKYRAVDARGNESELMRTVVVQPQPRGIIYLTFDDGPGAYTAHLLDVLANYKVKATFFVTGAGDDSVILREHNEGHTVALHTMSHNYAQIYASTDAYFADLYAVQARVKNITGETAMLMRFPGGSSNLVSARYDGGIGIMSRLAQMVTERGFTYFDWNISSGDAGGASTADEVYGNVVSRLEPGGTYVVLQHDIKGFSVDAVERIIQYGLANGFAFEKLDASSFTAHHGINN